jgi:hypothetical protein
LNISGVPYFDGQLAGRVLVSTSNWALINDEDCEQDGRHVHIILDKAHGHQDIWASALSKDNVKQMKHYQEFSW